MIKREVPYISYQDFLLKVLEMAEFLTYHRKKILVVFVISALLMTGLCGQLGFLMIARSDHYSKMADALHERERTIKASRGEIVDRNGTVIAANRTVVFQGDHPDECGKVGGGRDHESRTFRRKSR